MIDVNFFVNPELRNRDCRVSSNWEPDPFERFSAVFSSSGPRERLRQVLQYDMFESNDNDMIYYSYDPETVRYEGYVKEGVDVPRSYLKDILVDFDRFTEERKPFTKTYYPKPHTTEIEIPDREVVDIDEIEIRFRACDNPDRAAVDTNIVNSYGADVVSVFFSSFEPGYKQKIVHLKKLLNQKHFSYWRMRSLVSQDEQYAIIFEDYEDQPMFRIKRALLNAIVDDCQKFIQTKQPFTKTYR